jgi:hypothetical protein
MTKMDLSEHKNFVIFGRKVVPHGYNFPLAVIRCREKDFDYAIREASTRFKGSGNEVSRYEEVTIVPVAKVNVSDLHYAIDKLDIIIDVKDDKPATEETKPTEVAAGP